MDQDKVSEGNEKDLALPAAKTPEKSTILPNETIQKEPENLQTAKSTKVQEQEKVDIDETEKDPEPLAQKDDKGNDELLENEKRDRKENDKHDDQNKEKSQSAEVAPDLPIKSMDQDKEKSGAESKNKEQVQIKAEIDKKLVDQDLGQDGEHPVKNEQQKVGDLEKNGQLKTTEGTKSDREVELKSPPTSENTPTDDSITKVRKEESRTDGKPDQIPGDAKEPRLEIPDAKERQEEKTELNNEKVPDSAEEVKQHNNQEETKENKKETVELKKESVKEKQDQLQAKNAGVSLKLDDAKLLANGTAVVPEDDQYVKLLDPGVTEDNCKRLKEQLYRYTAGGTLQHGTRSQLQRLLRRHTFQTINISVFGFPNSGKSAFINTINFALSSSYEEICGERKVHSSDLVSLTNKRQFVSITEEIGLIDNKGVEEFSSQVLHEIGRQCEGYRGKDDFIPDDWNHGVKTTAKDILKFCCLGKLSRINDYIHCPVIVFNLDGPNDPEALLPLIQICQKCCGASPVVVMTHYDKVKEDKEILQRRKRQFQNLHCARMFCIENYTHDNHERRVETEQMAFEILSACCLVADHYLVEAILRPKSTKCC